MQDDCKPAYTSMSMSMELLGTSASASAQVHLLEGICSSASAQVPRAYGNMLQGLCSETMPLHNTQNTTTGWKPSMSACKCRIHQ